MSTQDFSLGKGKNLQSINLTGFKGGVKREQLQTEQEKSIFDALDTNKDGVIDEKEMQALTADLQKAAGKKDADNLSNGEAKDFLKEKGLKKIKKEDLFKFVQSLSQKSENIKECATDPQTGNILIEYNDGTKETIKPDKTSSREKTDDTGKTTTTQFNANNEPVEELVVEANGKDGTATIYQLDQDGNPIKDAEGNYIPAKTTVLSDEGKTKTETDYKDGVPTQKTVTSDDGKATDVTTYENGIPKEQIITKEGSKTVVQYDEKGQPKEAVETQGEYTVKNFTYVDGKPREMSRVENKGQDSEKTTTFQYNEDGTVLEECSELGGTKKTTRRLNSDGKPQAEEITEGDKKTQREYKEDGSATEIIKDGENVTQSQLNPQGSRLTQVKVVDGKQYQLQYDGEGNTEGIIVQNGESPAAIAKKFGVPVDKLLEVNSGKVVGKGKNRSFRVGDSIKIPREMEADEKVLQGRDSSAQAVAKYKKTMEARERDRQLRAMGLKNYQRAGENFTYGGKKYTIIGTMKNRERILVQDAKGNITVASWDNKILKDDYVANTNMYDFGKKVKAADGKEYVVVDDRKDGHGRKIVLDANGKTQILSGGKSQTDFSDRVLLRTDYVQASDAYDATGGTATITGKDGVKYVKDANGKVWYVDSKTGKFLVKGEYSNFVKQESDAISDKIYKAAKGWGTDEDKLKEGVGEIYSPEILAHVNTTLAAKDSDYKGDSHTMPLEALILDEETHGNSRQYFKTLINSGAMSTEQKGNTIARELQHEVEGGLGYTSTSSVNEVMNLVPNGDRDTRLAVETSLGKLRPDLKANEGSLTRAYLDKDGWSAQEVDQFDSNWVANNSYQPGVDQAHRNGVIGRLCFEYDDKEALHKGLRACSDDPNSEDYQYLTQRAIQANKEKGYQTQFTDQEAVQTYLAGRSNDGGEVDVEQLSACNTLLFKSSKPPRVQAEEALYGAKKGDMSNVFESMDAEVYDSMAEILANGDVPGCKTVKDAYNKAMSKANAQDKPSIKANAILSGHVEFSQQEITDFCVELMHAIDSNEGKGGSTGVSASHINDAEYQTEQLKAILSQHPEVLADVKAKVEAGKFESTSSITTPGGANGGSQVITVTKDNKAGYLDIINNTQCIVKDEVFLDENGNKITDPAIIADLKQRNNEALSQMREYVAQLEREFKMGVDEEGWLDNAGNALVRYSGIGTDRGDVANKYREAKRLLGQLEAAAQGKLRDNKGNVISAQQLAQNIIDKQDGLAQANTDYKSSVGMAKMGIVLAPVIVVTTVATAGTGAAGWAAVGVGAGATALTEGAMYGSNLLTSETGNTAENRAAVTSQVLQDTALAAMGIKVGQYAENFAVNGIKAVSAAERSAFAPQTWKIISKVPEGKVKDFFGAVSKASAKLEQTSADVGATVISKQANLLKKFVPGISDTKLQKAAVILARGEAAGLEITSDTVQTLGQMYLVDGEFNEQGFIEGMIMSVAGNSIGHVTSLKGELGAAGKAKPHIETPVDIDVNKGTQKPKTPVLDGIIGDGNKASGIKLGAEKVESVRNEIVQLISGADVNGADLADAYAKLNKIQNRDVRRELQSKITKAADGLTGAQKSAFQAQRAVQLKSDVDEIIAKKTVLEDADVRVITDYIKNENDITALQQLQEGLQQKRLQHRGTTDNYNKLGTTIDKKIKALNEAGEGVQGAGGKVGGDDGKVGGDDGRVGGDDGKVGGDDGKVGGDDGRVGGDDGRVGGDDGKVGGDDGRVGGDDGKVGGDDGRVGSDDGKVDGGGEALGVKGKIIEDNGNSIKIEINGKTYEILNVKNSGCSAHYFTSPVENTGTYKLLFGDDPILGAPLRARVHDLDQAMNMIEDVQMKQMINDELTRIAKDGSWGDIDDIEFLVDAQNAFEARSAIMKSNDYKGKSAIQRFNDYLRNDNLNTNDLLNNPTSSIHGNEVRGLKADIKLENRLYGVRQYMKQHPNSKISNHMYSKYLEELETIGVDKSVIDKCRRMDSEYGCKVMVSANLEEASKVMNYLDVEFSEWKIASGGQAKFPPVIDFSTVKSNWYDTGSAYGQSASGAYSEPGYNGSLAFPGMSESRVAWSMRHEMTHTNDLKHGYNIPPQYDLNRIMPKKPKLDSKGNQVMKDGQPVMVPDFKHCMFADEFRKAGISEGHIPYAYNNPKEFIAVAAEGDLSKCSPQFRQMLVDFGMPEWQLNMKPKSGIKVQADGITAREAAAFKDLEVNHFQAEQSGISRFFNKLLGNDIREQGSFRYKPPRLEKIASKDLDLSGIYIGNRVNVMGDMLEGKLPKGKAVIVAGDAKIRLADSWTLDLADPQIKKILDDLEEGRKLTVGTNGNIQCTTNNTAVSDNHLEIRKVNGEIVVRDISKNGAEILGNTGVSKGVQLAKRMKNYVAGFADTDIPKSMQNTWKKCRSEISNLADSFSMPDININTSALKAKYHSIMNDLSTIASKATAEVKAQLKQLMAKIKEMFNSFGVSAKSTAGVNPNITGRPDLDKYVTPQNKSIRISKENRELARTFDVDDSHVQFIRDNSELFKDNHTFGYWQGNNPADKHHGAWKMHMFSVDEADWQRMSKTLIPYLNEHGIEWKTLNMMHDVSHLNGDIQQGKAFTIYPRDNAHMEQVARDLDYIIRRNNLDIDASSIVGDRQMGGTGRLFYRYEFNTKQAQNEILDLGNDADYSRYLNLYDSNEGRVNRHGEGSYLADDMTAADDPWLNFDPGADLHGPTVRFDNGTSTQGSRFNNGSTTRYGHSNVYHQQHPEGPNHISAEPSPIEPMPMEAPSPMPAPQAGNAQKTVSALNDMETKYLPKYTQHPEITTSVLNEIAGKIKNGEVPSQEMLHDVLKNLSEQSGVGIKELERDFERCFNRNILGSDWQGIQKAFKTSEAKMLENIEAGSSLANRIDNFKTKRGLVPDSDISAKQGINQVSTATNAVNTEQIQTALSKNGLSFDADKNRFTISTEKRQSIQDLAEQKLGGDKQAAKKFIENLPQTLKSDDIANIQTMLNSCDGKYSSRLLENPDELLIFYSNLRNSGFFKFGEISDAQWKAIFNLVENPLSAENLGAIMRYKGAGFAAVNQAMTDAKIKGTPIPEHLQREIDALQNCISGQKVSDPFLVYRTEGIEFLDNFSINIDGQNTTLAEAMKNCKTEADRLKLMENVSKNNYTATQERFTSTSMFKPSNVGTNDASMIVWELEVQPGSQGIYIEGANYTGKLCREREFLLQKNSNIEITGMKFGDDGKWHLQGKIANSEAPQIKAGASADVPQSANTNMSKERVSVLTDLEAKYLPKYTKYPEQTLELLDTISTRIKNGEIPCEEMLNEILENISAKSGISVRDLSRDFDKSMTSFLSSDWQNLKKAFKQPLEYNSEALQAGGNSTARSIEKFKEKRGLLSDNEIQAKQEAQLRAQQDAELKAQQEAQLKTQKEAELKARQEAELQAQRKTQRLNQEKLEKFAEKYPEVVADGAFRDADSAVKLIDLMEKYDLQMDYNDFNSQYVYQQISAAGIKNDADMDKAFEMIKKRFHGDVIAEEARVKALKQQYHFSDYKTITHSDNVIAQLQKRMSDGEKISMDDIDNIIQDGMPDVREFRSIKKRILEAPELQKGLNDNLHLDVYSNPKYADFKDGIPDAMNILDNILADVKNGKTPSLELIQEHIDRINAKLSQNGKFVSSTSYWILQDVLRTHDTLGPQCKNFVEDIVQGGFEPNIRRMELP